MNRIIIFSVLLLIGSKSLYAQVGFEWAKMFEGGQSVGKSIVVDEKGNSYITGFFIGTVDFDPSPNVFMLNGTGGGDIFICKLDSQGNLVWAKGLQGSGPTSGSSDDQGLSIAIDSIGNVYTTGFFRKTVDFDPGPNTFNLTVVGSTPDNSDAFVLKLDSLGNFEWAFKMGNSQDGDVGNSIVADNNGFVYVTGVAAGHFISKINSQNGNIVWSKNFTGSSGIYGESVQIDKSGNVYSVGNFNNTADFDPSSNTYNLTSLNNYNAFISKLDSLGNFLWAKSFAGSSTSVSRAMSCVLDDFENLIIYGEFNGTVDFDPNVNISNSSVGSTSIYITKLDTSSNFIWSKTIEGARINDGVFDSDKSLNVDENGNLYLIGNFQNTVDFNPSAAQFNLTSQGGTDIFICLLDSSGNFNNAFSFGSSGLSTHDIGYSIAVDKYLSIHSTGFFHDVVDFDPSSSIFNLNGQSNAPNIFILKLSQCTNVYSTDVINSCDSYTWIDNVTYTSSNNTATHTIVNGSVNGCDSIVTLNLTINNSTTGTDVVNSCESYTWIDNITYTSSNNTATHTLTGANVNGCDSIVTLNLTIINIDSSITSNTPTLTANQSGASYRWLDCDNGYAVINGETSQSFTATTNGNYAVEVTVGSCVDTSSCMNIIISSIVEHDEIGFDLFPNPTNENITITINEIGKFTQLYITNIDGKIVYSIANISNNKLFIDVSKLEKGIYFVNINNEFTNNVVKLIKN